MLFSAFSVRIACRINDELHDNWLRRTSFNVKQKIETKLPAFLTENRQFSLLQNLNTEHYKRSYVTNHGSFNLRYILCFNLSDNRK